MWGGSNPNTSFDCSGFVSWALTESGVCNTGRLGAQGLYNMSTPLSSANARPGDLIFFVGTYDTPGISHVGIYVGGGDEYYEPPAETGPVTEPELLTPDGNMTLVDDIGGEATEDKQFITVVSKNGNYFYIIIDRADDGENTVHFLNQVDEADLLALMEEGETEETPIVCSCTDKCQAGTVNTACEVCIRILEKLREMGFNGGCSIVKAYVSNKKMDLNEKAAVRFETMPGKQGQMDWGFFEEYRVRHGYEH